MLTEIPTETPRGAQRAYHGLDASFAQDIVSGQASTAQIVAMLTSFQKEGLSGEQVLALARAFRQATVPAETAFPAVADLCGTGGGSVRTFNISTAASFVVAGCNVPVAKHGNRSNAGQSGSADLMEALGARLVMPPKRAAELLDEVGFSFFYAPTFNPAMRNAAEARRQMGGRTVFNLLGPLLNPVRAELRQLIGVHDPELLDLIPPLLEPMGIRRAMVVHGQPGMDEVSTLGTTDAVLVRGGSQERIVIDPAQLGLGRPSREELAERSPISSAITSREVLRSGSVGPVRDVVLLNAACALMVFGRAGDLEQGMRLAEHAIDSGRAERRIERYIALSRMSR
jgi:anthranilate phosphoribosyltransferase